MSRAGIIFIIVSTLLLAGGAWYVRSSFFQPERAFSFAADTASRADIQRALRGSGSVACRTADGAVFSGFVFMKDGQVRARATSVPETGMSDVFITEGHGFWWNTDQPRGIRSPLVQTSTATSSPAAFSGDLFKPAPLSRQELTRYLLREELLCFQTVVENDLFHVPPSIIFRTPAGQRQ